MMLAVLLLAAAVIAEPEPRPCPPPTLLNLYLLHAGEDGKCNYLAAEPCTAGVPIAFTVAAFGYTFACSPHTFAWDFGDGATSNQMTTFHTFMPGTYNVKATITNGSGSVMLIDRIVVEGTGGDRSPDFTYSTNANVVHFRIESFGLPITQWTFDFGDGTTATIDSVNPQEIVHSYAKGGTYVAVLTAGTFYARARQIVIMFPSRSRGARH